MASLREGASPCYGRECPEPQVRRGRSFRQAPAAGHARDPGAPGIPNLSRVYLSLPTRSRNHRGHHDAGIAYKINPIANPAIPSYNSTHLIIAPLPIASAGNDEIIGQWARIRGISELSRVVASPAQVLPQNKIGASAGIARANRNRLGSSPMARIAGTTATPICGNALRSNVTVDGLMWRIALTTVTSFLPVSPRRNKTDPRYLSSLDRVSAEFMFH
jgi:hypothetical protein